MLVTPQGTQTNIVSWAMMYVADFSMHLFQKCQMCVMLQNMLICDFIMCGLRKEDYPMCSLQGCSWYQQFINAMKQCRYANLRDRKPPKVLSNNDFPCFAGFWSICGSASFTGKCRYDPQDEGHIYMIISMVLAIEYLPSLISVPITTTRLNQLLLTNTWTIVKVQNMRIHCTVYLIMHDYWAQIMENLCPSLVLFLGSCLQSTLFLVLSGNRMTLNEVNGSWRPLGLRTRQIANRQTHTRAI